jgi:hypothetical protein
LSPVRAISVIRSLRAACVIQVLLPSMRQPVSVRLARVRSERQVGPGVGLGEHRRGQHLAGRDARQPLRLLLRRAGQRDQLAGDLRARAQRAGGDPGPAQLLGHHAHRQLAQAQAAVLRRDAHAEGAQCGHLGHDLVGDQHVVQVPLVGPRRDALVGEAPELLAHHVQVGVDQRVVDAGALADGRQQRLPVGRGVASARNQATKHRLQLRDALGQSQFGRAEDFALAHRDAARQLRQVLADGDAQHQALGLRPAGSPRPGAGPTAPRPAPPRRWS